jgi:hypothetical protein
MFVSPDSAEKNPAIPENDPQPAILSNGSESPPFLSPATAVGISGFICTVALHEYAMIGAYAALCLYALIGPKQAIKALSLTYIVIMLNPAIRVTPTELTTLRWVVILIAGLRVLPLIDSRSLYLIAPLLIFYAMVVALSTFNSPNFAISFLKISIFAYFTATVLVAFNSLDKSDLEELTKWFLTMTAVVILLSLPTLGIPKVGFNMNKSLFQGIFNHPQALGVFLAPMAAYLGAPLLLTNRNQSPYAWALWAMVMAIMLLTRARTALLAFFLSLVLASSIGIFRSRRSVLNLSPLRALAAAAVLLTVLTAGMLASQSLYNSVESFMLKGGKGGIGQSFYHSRGIGITYSWRRFLQNQLAGHGFGIDNTSGYQDNQESFVGIPVSASVESGFLPAAFMEQVGILGLAFFAPFFLGLVKKTFRRNHIGLISMFLACIMVNIGEAVFFSPGQIGGYLWLLIGLSGANGWERRPEYLTANS